MTTRVSMLLKSRTSLTPFRACFLPGRAKDLSAPRYKSPQQLSNLEISFLMLYIIEKNEVSRACSTYAGEVYAGFWWGNQRERPLRRPRCKWEDNIKMDLQEVGCGGMDWIELA